MNLDARELLPAILRTYRTNSEKFFRKPVPTHIPAATGLWPYPEPKVHLNLCHEWLLLGCLYTFPHPNYAPTWVTVPAYLGTRSLAQRVYLWPAGRRNTACFGASGPRRAAGTTSPGEPASPGEVHPGARAGSRRLTGKALPRHCCSLERATGQDVGPQTALSTLRL